MFFGLLQQLFKVWLMMTLKTFIVWVFLFLRANAIKWPFISSIIE